MCGADPALEGSRCSIFTAWSSVSAWFTHDTKGARSSIPARRCSAEPLAGFSTRAGSVAIMAISIAPRHRTVLVVAHDLTRKTGSRAAYGGDVSGNALNKLPRMAHPAARSSPHFGSWSAVVFGVPEFRDWLPLLRGVCRNYVLTASNWTSSVTRSFQVLGRGEAAATGSAEMTGLLHASGHDVEVGRKRGRPILLAVRVPTPSSSMRSSAGPGTLLATARGPVMATATRSSTLGICVKIGHSHGVNVSHPSMSRVCATCRPASCARPAAYRGRAMNEWAAGVVGV